MNGKQKCNILKNIRRDIAKANNIPLDIPECTHKGDCLGTCPRCEAEMSFLKRSLESRRKSGFKIALAGISAGLIAVNATSCDVIDNFANLINGNQIDGDIAYIGENAGGIMPAPDTFIDENTETALEGNVAVDSAVELIKGALPAITDIAGEIATEEYALEGDIAFIPDDTAEDSQ